MTVLSTLACVVTDAGITRPSYEDVLETLQAAFKSIYGSDAYIAPDSQDGQLLAVFAKAIDDANGVSLAVYNSFSPATAQGRALSNNVKINGISRGIATHSTAILRVTGTAGTTLDKCVASDANGARWLIPDGTVIPGAGFIDVSATAEAEGAIGAAAGTITGIATPILGWQEVTNLSQAQPGAPVESDAALRKRQAISVAIPSKTVLEGIVGAVAACPGVTQVRGYENDTNLADANGLPPHSIAVVTIGGVAFEIANAIWRKKTPGCSTHGSTNIVLTDTAGLPVNIKYTPAVQKRVVVGISIKALTGYLSTTGGRIITAVADYISALGIGKRIDFGRLYVPAQLYLNDPAAATFEVDGISLAFFGNAQGVVDLPIAYNETATCSPADITLVVT